MCGIMQAIFATRGGVLGFFALFLAVLRGGEPCAEAEGFAEIAEACEAAFLGDIRNREVGRVEEDFCVLDPAAREILREAGAGILTESA